MAFDVTNLGEYIGNTNDSKYAVQAVTESKFFKLLMDNGQVFFGGKGTEAVQKMSNSVNFQAGGTCGVRTSIDGVALSNIEITATQITDKTDLCAGQLHGTFYSKSLAAGQLPTEEFVPAFLTALREDRAKKISEKLGILLFKGDKTLPSGSKKVADGLLVQLTGSSYVNSATTATVITPTGATTFDRLTNAYFACNSTVRNSDDFYAFMSIDVMEEYFRDLDNKNFYSEADRNKIRATNAKIFSDVGLNADAETSGRVVIFGRVSDIVGITDGKGESEQAIIKQSTETDFTYVDFKFTAGIAPVYTKQFVIAKV